MSLLTLDVTKCIHTTNKLATCTKCVDACPVDTIKIDEHRLSFTPSECVGCNGCSAVCPTAAYSLDDFNPLNYIFSFLESDTDLVTCQSELPCIAGLSTEELLSMALFTQEDLRLDISPCASCDIAATNLAIIRQRHEEVNFLLEAMQQDKSLSFQEEAVEKEAEDERELSRRDLFKKEGLKKVISVKQQFENSVEASDTELKSHEVSNADIKKLKVKKVPDRRSLLLMAMKRAKVPELFHTISIDDISFSSEKKLDASTCTNCQMCYRICPTGALSSNIRGAYIEFNTMACVQCASCHDVCEPNALIKSSVFNLENLFESKKSTLIEFDMRRCHECNVPFAYTGGEVICTRCRIEEEEAKELWGIR